MQQLGQCLCGEIRYQVSTRSAKSFLCHCKDCQRSGGSFFNATVLLPKNDFEITSGELVQYQSRSNSGNEIVRGFCRKCGSGISIDIPDFDPNAVIIKAGTLDDISWVKPTWEIWAQSKSPCIKNLEDTKIYQGQPTRGSG
jgi:hypothetical protein